VKFWIIKARPDRNDFAKSPKQGQTSRWYTSRLPQKWARGDLLFVWAAAPRLQIVRLAELTVPNDGDEGGISHFRIRYLSDFFDGPKLSYLKQQRLFRDASFLKSGPSGTVFPLTEQQGRVLRKLIGSVTSLPGLVNLAAEEEAVARRAVGAGFGSPEVNKRVEKAALRAATAYLKSSGWTVRSVEAEKRGYDLHCSRRNGELLLAEVKGVRGTAMRFLLTAGEYRVALKNPAFALCVVTSVLRAPKVTVVKHSSLKDRLRVVPLVFTAELAK